MAKNYLYKDIFNLTMAENDAEARTIGQYLIRLAQSCWIEEDAFDGKRPFGNSGWKSEVYAALIHHKAIDGSFDEDGFIKECDDSHGNRIVNHLFKILWCGDFSKMPEYQEPKEWYLIYLGLTDDFAPRIIDALWEGRTEEDAKSLAAEKNSSLDVPRWLAVHIPS